LLPTALFAVGVPPDATTYSTGGFRTSRWQTAWGDRQAVSASLWMQKMSITQILYYQDGNERKFIMSAAISDGNSLFDFNQ
jgi:hypothetical protein